MHAPSSHPVAHGAPAATTRKSEIDALARQALTGHTAVVESLLAIVEPMVRRYCLARLSTYRRSYKSVDDVVQEICLGVLVALPRYRDRGGSFLYVVYTIASNKVADTFQERDRTTPVGEIPEQRSARQEPEQFVLASERGQRLARLLAELPHQQREILILRIALGLSSAETADALGSTPGTVRAHQHRALKRLRLLAAHRDQW
ncbi:MAG: sigma-70 family RNA polymerase sigma factor [Pseudonocardiaceae bacterium]|nr:sigma-70 family RNA polymerase sigma factor [Pseudonocardiaceae bacterium]